MKSILIILFFLLLGLKGFGQETISEEWILLSDSLKGCTTRGQYYNNAKYGGEACCFDISKDWQSFFKHSKEELSNFLLTQLSDTSQSSIHICPYFNATKGELAVYCLQRIYKVNWYDLNLKYKHIQDGSFVKDDGNFYSIQNELQKELKSKVGLVSLINEWKKKLK